MAEEFQVENLVRTWIDTYGITDPTQIAGADQTFRSLPPQQAQYWISNGPPPRQLTSQALNPAQPSALGLRPTGLGQAAGEAIGGVAGQVGTKGLGPLAGVLGRGGGPGTPYPETPLPSGPGPGAALPSPLPTFPGGGGQSLFGGPTTGGVGGSFQSPNLIGPGQAGGPSGGASLTDIINRGGGNLGGASLGGLVNQGSAPINAMNDYVESFGFNETYASPFNKDVPNHRGVDLVIKDAPNGGQGTPFQAFRGGTVVALTNDPNGGKGIIIQDERGLYHRYFHADDVLVKQGDKVQAGQNIGILGETGTKGAPHLHFEVAKGLNGDPLDQLIDPHPYMSVGPLESPAAAAATNPGTGPTGRAFNPARDKPLSWDEAAGFTADVARAHGYDDDAIKALLAVLRTEGGWNGAINRTDGGGSFGAFQFNGMQGNPLDQFADAHGLTHQMAADLLQKAPMAGVDWWLTQKLDGIVRDGQAAGLSGAELAVYIQDKGQVSKTPELAGQNYVAEWGPQAGGGTQQIPSLSGTAVSGSIPRFVGRRPVPRLPKEGFPTQESVAPHIQEIQDWEQLEIADLDPNAQDYKDKRDAIQTIAEKALGLAYAWRVEARLSGADAANQKIADAQLALEQQKFGLSQQELGLKREDLEFQRTRATRADYQWEQEWVRQGKRDDLEDYWRQVGATGWITTTDPVTGETNVQPTFEREQAKNTLDFQKEAARRQEEQFYVGKYTDWDQSFQKDLMEMAATKAGLYSQGQKAEAELLPWAFAPGQEYARGYEPGGIAQKLAEMTGTTFTPIDRSQTNTTYPYQGLEQYQQDTADLRNRQNPYENVFQQWLASRGPAPEGG